MGTCAHCQQQLQPALPRTTPVVPAGFGAEGSRRAVITLARPQSGGGLGPATVGGGWRGSGRRWRQTPWERQTRALSGCQMASTSWLSGHGQRVRDMGMAAIRAPRQGSAPVQPTRRAPRAAGGPPAGARGTVNWLLLLLGLCTWLLPHANAWVGISPTGDVTCALPRRAPRQSVAPQPCTPPVALLSLFCLALPACL